MTDDLGKYLAPYNKKKFDPTEIESGVHWRKEVIRRNLFLNKREDGIMFNPRVAKPVDTSLPDDGLCLCCYGILRGHDDDRKEVNRCHKHLFCGDCVVSWVSVVQEEFKRE